MIVTRMIKFVFVWVCMSVISYHAYGQACSVPFNIKFGKKTTTTVDLSWSDTNTAPLGWEIEIIKRGDTRTGSPSLPLVTKNNIVITALIPSTSYELYIRTVCNSGRSNWNVAIPFTTTLAVPTACNINIPLKDNGLETLILDIPEVNNANLILGKNIFLKSVSVIVEHDWPADLRLILESPQGQQLILSNHKGTVTDDFGNINDLGCQEVTTFSPEACNTLSDSKPPFIGVFRPDGDIRSWKLDTLSKGVWKLISFDRAIKDAGVLKYLDIKFTTEDCVVPEDFVILNTGTNDVTLGWNYKPPCKTVRIHVFKDGMPTDTIFPQCSEGKFTIKNLLPNTSYSFSLASVCSLDEVSQTSCLAKTTTSCEPVSHVEHFDNLAVCSASCNAACTFASKSWFNTTADDGLDWILWQGKTDTENTGPNADINTGGKYIYIESNPQLCGINKSAILQSACFSVFSNPSGCDMSFYYHMYGKDVESLTFEISDDNGVTWNPLFSESGDQGEQWNRVTLSLKAYHNRTVQFRFVAKTGSGALGDIAIDQIEFYKSVPVTALSRYYRDQDGDGLGTSEEFVDLCTATIPSGYVTLAGDCNDDNKLIYTGAQEIQCNGVDENCNGNDDDQPSVNPILIQSDLFSSSCNGSADGSIFLNITGGNPPYSVQWSNMMQGPSISNLSNGVYHATVTDVGGCVTKTPFYQINAATNLNILVSELKRPTCLGIDDGNITIIHNIDFPPYTYQWSNGSTTKNITGVGEGFYTVTVTDANQCFKVLEQIKLLAQPSLITNVRLLSNPRCYGQEKGAIELITINGTAPYQYRWSTGETSVNINNLAVGTYSCTITDTKGCISVFETKITSPPPLDIKIVSTEDVRCHSESNGSIKTQVSGGKPGYTYLWNKLSEITDDIYNLSAGTYQLTVSDDNGCSQVSQPIIIHEPEPFKVSVDSLRPALCISGKNGYIGIQASGGNGNYNYVWNYTQISTPIIDSIPSGSYNVTAYDILGCKSGIPNIFLPFTNKDLDVPISLITDNLCFKDKKAIISAQINEGIPPFDYNWSHGVQYFNPENMDTIHSLSAGNYSLTITDAFGCVGISNVIQIIEKDPYSFSISKIVDNLCDSDTTGIIAIQVQGGTAPVSVVWNGGLYTGNEITNLPAGMYTALILDKNLCKLETTPVMVRAMSNMVLESNVSNATPGMSNGKICVDVAGGSPPYLYDWSNGDNAVPCLENLSAGVYKVTISDMLGCEKIGAFTIESQTNASQEEKPVLKVYPNPFFDKIYFNHLTDVTSVSISTLDGKVLKKINQSEIIGTNSLDLNSWLPGMYLLGVEINGIVKRYKVIKIQ